jgi:hypothetical protein
LKKLILNVLIKTGTIEFTAIDLSLSLLKGHIQIGIIISIDILCLAPHKSISGGRKACVHYTVGQLHVTCLIILA